MKRTIVVDDLDGESEGAQEVDFALDGDAYQIDLCEPNLKLLKEALRPYIDVARPVRNAPPPARRIQRRGHPPVAKPQRVQPMQPVQHAPVVQPEPVIEPEPATVSLPAAPKGQDDVRHSPEELKSIRSWAKAKGVPLAPKARVPQCVWDAWRNGDLSLLDEKHRPPVDLEPSEATG